MTNRSSLLAFLALTSTALLACRPDTPSRGDAEFASMSDEDRQSSISTATGGSAGVAMYLFVSAEFASGYDAQCPSRTVSGTSVTYRADDCTSQQGVPYDGTLRGRNAPSYSGDPAIQNMQPMSIEMDGWLADDRVFDGTHEQSVALPGEGVLFTVETSYTLDDGEYLRAFELTADCAHHLSGDDCAVEGFTDLPSGSFELEGDNLGVVELRGKDTLSIDFGAVEDGCAPYTIDGKAAGEYCF